MPSLLTPVALPKGQMNHFTLSNLSHSKNITTTYQNNSATEHDVLSSLTEFVRHLYSATDICEGARSYCVVTSKVDIHSATNKP
jgi:hypothetical protein